MDPDTLLKHQRSDEDLDEIKGENDDVKRDDVKVRKSAEYVSYRPRNDPKICRVKKEGNESLTA